MLDCDIVKNKCKTRKLKKMKKMKKNNNKTMKRMKKIFSNGKLGSLKSKSYSPTINRGDITIKDATNVFVKCKKYELSIPKNGKRKCYPWNSEESKNVLLNNLMVKKIDPNKLIIPKQDRGNCWFNTLFMCFFISDKGRKFTRYIRKTMITGELPNSNNKIDKNFHKNLWIFNKFIEISLRGRYFMSRWHGSVKTNIIIKDLYEYMKSKKMRVSKVGEGGHPINYFSTIINSLFYLNENPVNFLKITSHSKEKYQKVIGDYTKNKKLHYFSLSIHRKNQFKKEKTIKVYSEMEKKVIKYELDSAVMVDNENDEHAMCFFTINKKGHGFDAECINSIYTVDWKKHINLDKNFNSGNGKCWVSGFSKSARFNFMDSMQMLNYYRVTK